MYIIMYISPHLWYSLVFWRWWSQEEKKRTERLWIITPRLDMVIIDQGQRLNIWFFSGIVLFGILLLLILTTVNHPFDGCVGTLEVYREVTTEDFIYTQYSSFKSSLGNLGRLPLKVLQWPNFDWRFEIYSNTTCTHKGVCYPAQFNVDHLKKLKQLN